MPSCPICPFNDDFTHNVQVHIELVHFRDDSAFSTPELGSSISEAENVEEDKVMIQCPEDGCCEVLAWQELQTHLDLHDAAQLDHEDAEDFDSECGPPEPETVAAEETLAVRHSVLIPQASARLGVSSIVDTNDKEKELGPHAFEKRMPRYMMDILEKGAPIQSFEYVQLDGQIQRKKSPSNAVHGVVPVLSRLLQKDNVVKEAWLCHESTQYIHKLKDEGYFCGYRTAQVLLSYIVNTKSDGYREIRHRLASIGVTGALPGVLTLQELIEQAWDAEDYPRGRIETGGVRGTRKYIGAPEMRSLFDFLKIPITIRMCADDGPNGHTGSSPKSAAQKLLDLCQQYFSQPLFQIPPDQLGDNLHNFTKVRHTTLPPIYLQVQGHSNAIVGVEVRHDGSKRLLIFDSAKPLGSGLRACLTAGADLSAPTSSSSHVNKQRPVMVRARRKDGSIETWLRPAKTVKPQMNKTHASPISTSRRSVEERRYDVLSTRQVASFLASFRRDEKRLVRHKVFELVMLRAGVSFSA